MADIYYTIVKEGEGLYKEKMSRFLSFAVPVESPDDAKLKVKEFQNAYHDARHVCWAYMIGPERSIWQLNDNGEPSGTAGKPILGQINSKNLTNVLVVVVRYFGGIKLGTSGLIEAYREATREALENAGVKECHDMTTLRFDFDYEAMDGIMKIIKSNNLEIINREMNNICSFSLSVRKDHAASVSRMLADRGARFTDEF